MNRDARVAYLVVALVALVAAGFVPAPGADNAFYVILPYAACLVATGTGLMSIWTKDDEDFGRPRRGIRKHLSWPAASSCAVFGLGAAVVTVVGEVLHVLMRGASGGFGLLGGTETGLLHVLGYVGLVAVAGYALYRAWKCPEE